MIRVKPFRGTTLYGYKRCPSLAGTDITWVIAILFWRLVIDVTELLGGCSALVANSVQVGVVYEALIYTRIHMNLDAIATIFSNVIAADDIS